MLLVFIARVNIRKLVQGFLYMNNIRETSIIRYENLRKKISKLVKAAVTDILID